jgi:hypothetical protein
MRFPIAADLETRDGTLDADALLTNAFAEVVGADSAASKRAGCASLGSVTAGNGQLLAEFAGKAIAVAGDALSTITVSPFAIDDTDALSPIYSGLTLTSSADKDQLLIKTSREAWVYAP